MCTILAYTLLLHWHTPLCIWLCHNRPLAKKSGNNWNSFTSIWLSLSLFYIWFNSMQKKNGVMHNFKLNFLFRKLKAENAKGKSTMLSLADFMWNRMQYKLITNRNYTPKAEKKINLHITPIQSLALVLLYFTNQPAISKWKIAAIWKGM